jgi:hypothetical protein
MGEYGLLFGEPDIVEKEKEKEWKLEVNGVSIVLT